MRTLETLTGLSIEALGSIAFLAVAILLLIYSVRFWGKRRKELQILMPRLGFHPIAEPSAQELIPDQLFHPNGFANQEQPTGRGEWQDNLPRVTDAWAGQLGGYSVTLMDISIPRREYKAFSINQSDIQHQLNRTVIRYSPGEERRPPDFLIEEHVLFKSRVRGERSVNGPAQIGQHYFVFSDASQEELEPWITSKLRDELAKVRLWRIASHHGVLYLSRGTSFVLPGEISSFLEEGRALLAGSLAE